MVFILALGYYITPALVGGGSDQMLSYFVATYTTDTGNWGLAAALGLLLLGTTAALYAAAHKLSGGRVMAMGS
jgi:putative spermidine/putrescine transport system permease protein